MSPSFVASEPSARVHRQADRATDGGRAGHGKSSPRYREEARWVFHRPLLCAQSFSKTDEVHRPGQEAAPDGRWGLRHPHPDYSNFTVGYMKIYKEALRWREAGLAGASWPIKMMGTRCMGFSPSTSSSWKRCTGGGKNVNATVSYIANGTACRR